MNDRKKVLDERLVDLMLLASTVGLSEQEQRELDQLTSSIEDRDWFDQEMERLELAAAALDLSMTDISEEVPADLQSRLKADAERFFSKQTSVDQALSDSNTTNNVDVDSSQVDTRNAHSERHARGSGFNWREFAAIAVAAACLLIMLSGFNPFSKTDLAKSVPPSERLIQLTQSSPVDLLDIEWTSVHDPDAAGRVVWSDQKQEGYMVFDNLDVNDPQKEQYQLWIFDTDKGQAHPVDGGVFDIVDGSKQVIVPIKAHLPVTKAVQFAVTVEKPGGVTVSKREKIPVLAAVE